MSFSFTVPEQFFTLLVGNYWNFHLHQLIGHKAPPLEDLAPPGHPATGPLHAGGGGGQADGDDVWLELSGHLVDNFYNVSYLPGTGLVHL